jgi:glucose-6-phosphate isomerase
MSVSSAIMQTLAPHADRLNKAHLRDLLAKDSDRFSRFSQTACGLLLDWSKEKVDQDAWDALLALASKRGVASARDAMLRGDPINLTEGRAVLHTALRGGDWAPQAERSVIKSELARVLQFAEEVRSGAVRASDGGPFTHVINIGIGGSDLGPAMAVRALAPFLRRSDRCIFVSNVDGAHAVGCSQGPRSAAHAGSGRLKDVYDARDADQCSHRARLADASGVGEANVSRQHLAALSTNARTLPQAFRHRRLSVSSASGLSLVGATPSGRPSGCRSCWPLAQDRFEAFPCRCPRARHAFCRSAALLTTCR